MSMPSMMNAAPARSPSARSGSTIIRLALLIGVPLLIAGISGLDPLLYRLSIFLNDPDLLDPRDLYHRTAWFWDLCRLPAHWFGVGVVFFGLLLAHPIQRRRLVAAAMAFAVAGLTTLTLQPLVGRIRPNRARPHLQFIGPVSPFHPHEPVCFPSGESTAAFGLAAVLAAFVRRGRALIFGVAAFTAIARLVCGSHYLSDVVAGALIGTCGTTLLIEQFARRLPRWLDQRFGEQKPLWH